MATDGGVTFGGGEPGLYARFIHEFARKYGGRWSINMETSLNFPRENLLLLLDAIDYYFIDIKDMDPEIYKAYTGGDNSLVLENLKYLCELNCQHKIRIRIPQIEKYNTAENCDASEAYCRSMGFTHFDRFRYLIRE